MIQISNNLNTTTSTTDEAMKSQLTSMLDDISGKSITTSPNAMTSDGKSTEESEGMLIHLTCTNDILVSIPFIKSKE